MSTEAQPLKVYKSSAGSGKTTILVYNYLSLILPEPDNFSRILAITFTNKAANEMKERITQYLQNLITPGSAKEELPEDLHQSLQEQLEGLHLNIQTQAALCLNKILHTYSDFAVSTIDSFLYKIIRSFAKDLNLSWDFEVELETDEMFREIIDLLMENYGKDEFMTKQIIELVEDKLNDGKSWRVEQDILELSRKLLESDAHPQYLENLLEIDSDRIKELRESFSLQNKQLLKQAKAHATKAIDILQANGLSPDTLSHKKSGIGGYFSTIATKDASHVFKVNTYVEKAVEKKCLYSKGTKEHLKEKIDSITPPLLDQYEKLNKIREQAAYFHGRLAVYKNLHILGILKYIKQTYEAVKSEYGILPISEFSRNIAKITLNEDIPYIYERLGEKYQHFFIDEFQDTSTLQWENILPLLENALSTGHCNLIVGDVKQAIYRFRGGNAEQLSNMPDPPPNIRSPRSLERYKILQNNTVTEELDVNYRSAKEIVEFNNDFFEFVKNQLSPDQKPFYEKVEQKYCNPEGGQVSISLQEEQTHPEKTLEIINDLITKGFNLKDIAILCRKNKQAQEMAVFLMNQQITQPGKKHSDYIRVISDESLTLKQSAAVNTLISFARLMAYPEDNVQLFNILYYHFENNHPEDDFHGWLRQFQPLPSTIDQIEHLFSKLGYTLNINNLAHFDLYNFFEHLATRLHMDVLNNPYLQFFFDEVSGFSKNKAIPVIYEFLKWWEENGRKKSVIAPEGIDAILVKSIHKSKGLAFPVVIYPFATEKANGSKGFRPTFKWVKLDPLISSPVKASVIKLSKETISKSVFYKTLENEIEAERLDMINVLYVCMTRPRKHLYIISERTKKPEDPLSSLAGLFTAYLNHKNIQADEFLFPASPQKKPTETKEKKDPFAKTFNYKRLQNWQEKLFVCKPATKNILPGLSKKRTGTLVHHYLSLLTYQEQLNDVLAQINNQIQEKELAENISNAVKKVVLQPRLNTWFQRGEHIIKNECEILTEKGILRPDRIVLAEKQIVIIDYKTGEKVQAHEDQIKEYARYLNKLYDIKTTGILVYINKDIHIHEENSY
ncbi:MAG: UvrD-helicase domain-containing protein [Bacteroidales bacterium]